MNTNRLSAPVKYWAAEMYSPGLNASWKKQKINCQETNNQNDG